MVTADEFRAAIDRKMLIDIAAGIIESPSPTGYEAPTALYLESLWRDLGLETKLQTLYEERFNVVGLLPGADRGAPSILFSGHTDTSMRGDEEWLEAEGWKNKARVVDDTWIFGNGIFNMKNAFVCYTMMVATMKKLGLTLPGDIILAGTCGEVELAGVDEFQGRDYDSCGTGLRYLINHGHHADYHILGEPSTMVPTIGTMGTVWIRVETSGDFSHSAFTDSQVSAIDEAAELWRGMAPWIEKYREENIFMGVHPQVNRAAIRGGFPYRAARTAKSCVTYIDIRFPPTMYPIDVQRMVADELHRIAAERLTNGIKIDYYLSRPGTLLPTNHPLVEATVKANKAVTGRDIGFRFSPPFCNDGIDANRHGIPTVLFGAGGRSLPEEAAGDKHADIRNSIGEFILIDDMVDTTVVYYLVANELMSKGRAGVERARELFPMPGVALT